MSHTKVKQTQGWHQLNFFLYRQNWHSKQTEPPMIYPQLYTHLMLNLFYASIQTNKTMTTRKTIRFIFSFITHVYYLHAILHPSLYLALPAYPGIPLSWPSWSISGYFHTQLRQVLIHKLPFQPTLFFLSILLFPLPCLFPQSPSLSTPLLRIKPRASSTSGKYPPLSCIICPPSFLVLTLKHNNPRILVTQPPKKLRLQVCTTKST